MPLRSIVASGAHPKTTILDLAGGENFPDDVRSDMEAYRTRGASVKVNMVLSEPPVYEGLSEEDSKHLLTAGVNYCPSLDYLERAWQDAVRGVPSENPYTELEVPSDTEVTILLPNLGASAVSDSTSSTSCRGPGAWRPIRPARPCGQRCRGAVDRR